MWNISSSELPRSLPARSKAEFIARIGVVAEEADEAVLWIEWLTESGIVKPELTESLRKEARELAAMLTASRQTAKRTA
jgi:four helix bundle protein